jgi:hypothetical protein
MILCCGKKKSAEEFYGKIFHALSMIRLFAPNCKLDEQIEIIITNRLSIFQTR